MKLSVPITIIALLAIAILAVAEEKFPGIEKLMSDPEYQITGLHKLSDQERRALNAWLVRYTAGEALTLARSNKEVKAAAKELDIYSTIVPPFDGWFGHTMFTLTNGQVWQQRRDSNYIFRGQDLRVAIRKNVFGFHTLTLLEASKSVQVKRLQ